MYEVDIYFDHKLEELLSICLLLKNLTGGDILHVFIKLTLLLPCSLTL